MVNLNIAKINEKTAYTLNMSTLMVKDTQGVEYIIVDLRGRGFFCEGEDWRTTDGPDNPETSCDQEGHYALKRLLYPESDALTWLCTAHLMMEVADPKKFTHAAGSITLTKRG